MPHHLARRDSLTGKEAAPKLGAHRLRNMLAKVLDYAAPTLREVAAQAGISYAAIRDYRKARRTPSAAVTRRLVTVLRARGGRLRELAADIERLAGARRRGRRQGGNT